VIKKLHYEVGQMAQVGLTLVDIEVDEQTAIAAHATEPPKKVAEPIKVQPIVKDVVHTMELPKRIVSTTTQKIVMAKGGKILTTPSVRRLAREHNIELEDVPVQGDRVTKGDILEYIRLLAQENMEIKNSSNDISSERSPSFEKQAQTVDYLEESKTVPLTMMQKMMVKSMTAALCVPHFGYADEIEMDALDVLRKQLKPLADERGVKITYLPLLIKAASLSLKYYPILNATLTESEASLTMHAQHNISVAMDTPTGLIVPNVKNVQSKICCRNC